MTDETETREPYQPKQPVEKPKDDRSIWNRLPQNKRDRINEALRKAGIGNPMP